MLAWRDLSIAKKLYLVIGTMAVLIAGELLALRFAMGTLSAVRGFVGGESLWSKAQKDSAFRIQRFGVTRNEEDFRAFLDYLKVPEGDHLARMELGKPHPDMSIVRQGFLQGHIHPDDIDPLVNLLRRFSWEPHIEHAIRIWVEADDLLKNFKEAGIEYHRLLTAPRPPGSSLVAQALDRMRNLNERLTPVEEEFSRVLGEGSRWLEGVVISLLFGAVLTVESIGLTLTILTSRAISRGLASINEAARRIGQGDFQHEAPVISRDEIGQLALGVNAMGRLLERSYGDLERRVHERTQELEKMATENAELYDQARSAVQLRDEFLSVASHELKTPLTALNLRLELLVRQLKLGSESAQTVTRNAEAALRDIRRMGALSSELMDLTRIRVGRLELKRERCDLAAIAREIGDLLRPEAEKEGSSLQVDASGEVLGFLDPLRVSQIVTNLITNAIKYGRGQPIGVKVATQGEELWIEVRDHGIGISPETQARIFERFERAGADEKIPGLGLGLYITRQLVLAHGGQISVSSVPGEGSTFRVVLPSQAGETASQGEPKRVG